MVAGTSSGPTTTPQAPTTRAGPLFDLHPDEGRRPGVRAGAGGDFEPDLLAAHEGTGHQGQRFLRVRVARITPNAGRPDGFGDRPRHRRRSRNRRLDGGRVLRCRGDCGGLRRPA